MITYYTALGRLITKSENGRKIPAVVIDGKESYMSIDELMVWGSLHWNFYNREDLEKEYYRRKNNAHIFDDSSFEHTVHRLEQRNLICSAADYLAVDALYALIGQLRIKPIKFNKLDKVRSFAYMYIQKGVPLKNCFMALFGPKITADERSILKLSEKVPITAAEIIKCIEEDIPDISDEEGLMDKLYNDPDITQDTIFTASRFSNLKTEVLQTVSNLYLKKRIVFEN